MSNLPTPIEVYDKNGQPYMADLVDGDKYRLLERELTEAKAERDALKTELEQPDHFDFLAPVEAFHSWMDRHGLESCRKGTSADLSRWRALAEELAGALRICRNALFIETEWNAGRGEGANHGYAIDLADEALARFRDAANPASARTPPGTNERSGDE